MRNRPQPLGRNAPRRTAGNASVETMSLIASVVIVGVLGMPMLGAAFRTAISDDGVGEAHEARLAGSVSTDNAPVGALTGAAHLERMPDAANLASPDDVSFGSGQAATGPGIVVAGGDAPQPVADNKHKPGQPRVFYRRTDMSMWNYLGAAFAAFMIWQGGSGLFGVGKALLGPGVGLASKFTVGSTGALAPLWKFAAHSFGSLGIGVNNIVSALPKPGSGIMTALGVGGILLGIPALVGGSIFAGAISIGLGAWNLFRANEMRKLEEAYEEVEPGVYLERGVDPAELHADGIAAEQDVDPATGSNRPHVANDGTSTTKAFFSTHQLAPGELPKTVNPLCLVLRCSDLAQ